MSYADDYCDYLAYFNPFNVDDGYGYTGESENWVEKNIYFAQKDFNTINLNNESEENKMANVKATRNETKVTTGKVRLSYTHIFEAHAMEGNDPKFSTAILIPKSDTDTLKAIKEAVELAKKNGIGKWNGKIPAGLKTPLRDGDVEKPDDENYAGCYFLNASSKNKPGVVDENVQPVLDATEVYSGCYARLTLNFYAYNASGNKGIAAGLGNIQKLGDGEPLGGFTRAEDEFGVVASTSADDDFLS